MDLWSRALRVGEEWRQRCSYLLQKLSVLGVVLSLASFLVAEAGTELDGESRHFGASPTVCMQLGVPEWLRNCCCTAGSVRL